MVPMGRFNNVGQKNKKAADSIQLENREKARISSIVALERLASKDWDSKDILA